MKDNDFSPDDLAQHARRLGGFDKRCVICGEPNPRCLELHHIAGRAYSEDVVPVCRNCHRKITDRTENAKAPSNPAILESAAHWLLGAVQLLLLLCDSGRLIAEQLIEGMRDCPPPYGYAGEESTNEPD
jgi:HNH endonuclease